MSTINASEARKRKVVMVSPAGKETVFQSIKDASEMTGLYQPCICRCCRGKQKNTGGFAFRYYQ